MKKQLEPEAFKNVLYRLILEEIIKLEDIKVDDKEVEKELDASGRIKLNHMFRFCEDLENSGERIKGEWKKICELQNIEKLVAAGLTLPPAQK